MIYLAPGTDYFFNYKIKGDKYANYIMSELKDSYSDYYNYDDYDDYDDYDYYYDWD